MSIFFKLRIVRSSLILALICGFLLAILQIIQSARPILTNSNNFSDSPYTRWLSIDMFFSGSMMFFMLLPLIACIPTSMLLKEDMDSGFIQQIQIRKRTDHLILGYILTAFLGGFLVIMITMAFNFVSYFVLLPNLKPDNLLNSNLLISDQNTLFVSMYYRHPLIHAIASIIFTSLWGGLFASFAAAISIWCKNKFVGLFSGLFLQIFLFILNIIIKLPDNHSYVPFDFIREESPSFIDLKTTMISTLIMIICTTILILKGRSKKIVW